jgi:hypothetical protein
VNDCAVGPIVVNRRYLGPVAFALCGDERDALLEPFKKYCSHRPVAGLPKRCFSHQEHGPQGRGYSGYGFI